MRGVPTRVPACARRTVSLSDVPKSVPARLSAVSRYTLYVNGTGGCARSGPGDEALPDVMDGVLGGRYRQPRLVVHANA